MDDAQNDLFGIDDARTATQQMIVALGGPKKAGPLLWPSMTIDDAADKLNRCLNPRKRDAMKIEEWLLLCREARQAGCLIGVAFVNDYCDCAAPVPITPEDVEDELRREFIHASDRMESIVKRMETLEKRRRVGRVV